MKPEIIRFLRREAHKMYLGLTFDQRRLTNEQRIYRGLKQAWKAGSKLTVAQRGAAKGLPINFKNLDQLTRNLVSGAGKVNEVQAVERYQQEKLSTGMRIQRVSEGVEGLSISELGKVSHAGLFGH